MKRTLFLILFALFDILLIGGILLFVKDSGALKANPEKNAQTVQTTEEASVAEAPASSETVSGDTAADGTASSETVLKEMAQANTGDIGEIIEEVRAKGAESGLTQEDLKALEEALDDALSNAEEIRDGAADSAASVAENMAAAAEEASSASTVESAVSGAESVVLASAGTASAAEPVSTAESLLTPTKRCLVDSTFWEGCPERDIQLLTPNPYSRPQYALDVVHDIVIHYVGNPGTTAQQNRDYFESLKDGSHSASSHFVVGLDGEIIQCISCSEWSYASNQRNYDTISIECCHPDATGKFTDATYQSVVKLTAWLCKAFECGPEHVIRHHDVTGKICPKYYVENPDAWEQMLADIKTEYDRITD